MLLKSRTLLFHHEGSSESQCVSCHEISYFVAVTNVLELTLHPITARQYSIIPHPESKAVYFLSSSARGSWKYTKVRSKVEKYFDLGGTDASMSLTGLGFTATGTIFYIKSSTI